MYLQAHHSGRLEGQDSAGFLLLTCYTAQTMLVPYTAIMKVSLKIFSFFFHAGDLLQHLTNAAKPICLFHRGARLKRTHLCGISLMMASFV